MIKRAHVAYQVRVLLNDTFETGSVAKENMKQEEWCYISDPHISNDDYKGDYVHIRGASGLNGCIAYLSELELQYPLPEFLR